MDPSRPTRRARAGGWRIPASAFASAGAPRIVRGARRPEHQRRRTDFFHVDQIAAVGAQRWRVRSRRPQQRRAERLQIHRQHPRAQSRSDTATTIIGAIGVSDCLFEDRTLIKPEVFICPREMANPRLHLYRPMSLRIVHYNEPVLRTKGEKVTAFDAALADVRGRHDRHDARSQGIGLAAQQIGRALQLCVVDLRGAEAEFHLGTRRRQPPLDLFMPHGRSSNPQVTIMPGPPDSLFEEGCLSFPKIRGDVARPDAITVNFKDEQGVPHVLKDATDFSRGASSMRSIT